MQGQDDDSVACTSNIEACLHVKNLLPPLGHLRFAWCLCLFRNLLGTKKIDQGDANRKLDTDEKLGVSIYDFCSVECKHLYSSVFIMERNLYDIQVLTTAPTSLAAAHLQDSHLHKLQSLTWMALQISDSESPVPYLPVHASPAHGFMAQGKTLAWLVPKLMAPHVSVRLDGAARHCLT